MVRSSIIGTFTRDSGRTMRADWSATQVNLTVGRPSAAVGVAEPPAGSIVTPTADATGRPSTTCDGSAACAPVAVAPDGHRAPCAPTVQSS